MQVYALQGIPPLHRHLPDYRTTQSNWKGIYFGGVAFKYQEDVTDLAKVAVAAMPFLDVITTSGVGTGIAPNLEKIKHMKNAVEITR